MRCRRFLDEPGEASGPHHAGDPLVVHAVLECGTVVELGRDPWDTLSVVLGVDDADPLQQL